MAFINCLLVAKRIDRRENKVEYIDVGVINTLIYFKSQELPSFFLLKKKSTNNKQNLSFGFQDSQIGFSQEFFPKFTSYFSLLINQSNYFYIK